MQRRELLRATSGIAVAMGTASFAGCVGAPEPEAEGTEPAGGMDTDTPAETATGTPTATETPAGTETPTGTEGGTEQTPTGGGGGGAAANTIEMETEGSSFYFDPVGLYVAPGETVTWTLASGSHSSTAYAKGNGPASVTRIPQGAKAWDSGILSEAGAEFSYTFEATGTYDYFCIPHKSLGMVGRIVCGEPGGPAEGSQPPDGAVPESQTIVQKKVVPFGSEYASK